MLDIVVGQTKNVLAQKQLVSTLRNANLTGTLYTGYPIIASADEMIVIDAMLTCLEHGLIVIDYLNPARVENIAGVLARQDDLYTALKRKLLEYKPLIEKRDLSIAINVLTFTPVDNQILELDGTHLAGPATLLSSLDEFPAIGPQKLRLLNAAIQRVATIKPTVKRNNISKPDSRGSVIQRIEREIANLDQWQKKAAIESPEGPQRVRGLAGSGKTVVLALKAAYLHAANPNWTIAVTFHTRALYQQFTDLIRRFCFEHKNDEPDWTKLRVLHAWGSARRPGVYYEIAAANKLPVRDLAYTRSNFTSETGFKGICDELLAGLKSNQPPELFDAILIDEAQDLPRSFFEACYLSTRDPKRVIWAYDELQNLGAYAMAPPAELFGRTADGRPNVPNLESVEGEPKRDIVLPVCYRNTPWALTTAHAVGFGVYRHGGLIQFFDDLALWEDIGYRVRSGSLQPGQEVELGRSANSYPQYFKELLTASDAVQWQSFPSQDAQAASIASSIHENLEHDELKHTDILVVVPNALTVRSESARLISELNKYNIPSHLAGVTSSVDWLYQEGSVAISGIYRAKGNEAAIVYIMDADYALSPYIATRARNVLFTAITRSRAWVRICGCGGQMDALIQELEQVRSHDYRLQFRVPTEEERKRIRRIHRDKTDAEIARQKEVVSSFEEVLGMIDNGELDPEEIPDPIRKRLAVLLAHPDDAE